MTDREILCIKNRIERLRARNTEGRNTRLINKYTRKLLKMGLEV